jgi:hypothetical protein
LVSRVIAYPELYDVSRIIDLKGIEWFDMVRCLVSNEGAVIKTPLAQSVRKLSEDINLHGLKHPVLIYANKVIYGMQRCVVAKYLNYDYISSYYCDTMKQLEKIHQEQINAEV